MNAWVPLLVCLGIVLSGCSSKNSSETSSDLPEPGVVEVSATTGGIRGVVVDQAIRPVKGAAIDVAGPEKKSATSDVNGAFTLGGLQPGTYLVRATHPFYSTAQTSVDVVAGIANPDVVKVQLQQVIFTKPYLRTTEFKGFIVCSVGTSFAASEECGEGVGVPCTVPGVPCGRQGGQANNHVQYDFYPDSPRVRSIVVEQVWQANAEATGEFYTVLATDWTCNPVCEGNELNVTVGPSPLYLRAEFTDGAGSGIENVSAATRFSTFTWPNWGEGSSDPSQANVAVNQEFQVLVTTSYELPLPAGWSFVRGDVNPFA